MTDSTNTMLVYMTAPDEITAERLAHAAVAARLAACANMISGMRSIYWWQGKMERADEVVVLFKTRGALFSQLEAMLKEEHPYECPCIVALPITAGNADYLGWIAAETDAEV